MENVDAGESCGDGWVFPSRRAMSFVFEAPVVPATSRPCVFYRLAYDSILKINQ